MSKQKKFKCKNEAQKKAIKANYARIADKNKNSKIVKGPKIGNKTKFKLPLKNGGHRWNIYKVSNKILNGKHDGGVHGGLVIDEKNGNVLLVQVTHSSRNEHNKRNNYQIRNLDSSDLDKDGNLRKSYIEKRLIVEYKTKGGLRSIGLDKLNGQMNDLNFDEDEKKIIIEALSNLSTAEERYTLFLENAKKKGDT